MPPDPPREQGPPGLATPSQINATPTSKTVENPALLHNKELKKNFSSWYLISICLAKSERVHVSALL